MYLMNLGIKCRHFHQFRGYVVITPIFTYYSIFTYFLNNLDKIHKVFFVFLKMYLNYFLRIIKIKGYKNCIRNKNGNKEFS